MRHVGWSDGWGARVVVRMVGCNGVAARVAVAWAGAALLAVMARHRDDR